MALESSTYISGLVATNPVTGDGVKEGDDHIRLLKSTLLNTFPNITGAVTPTHTELNFVDGVTSSIQTQLNLKAPLASPTFTGTVTLPAATSIGAVSSTELTYLDGVTSAIQTQLNSKAASSHTHAQSDISGLTADLAAKAPIASPTFTGTPSAPTAAPGTNTTQIATTAFVEAAIDAIPPGTTGGLTLLATIATTSGTAHEVTAIPSTYRALMLELQGVSAGATFQLELYGSHDNATFGGQTVISDSTINAAELVSGCVWVYNIQSTALAFPVQPYVARSNGSAGLFSTPDVLDLNGSSTGPLTAIRITADGQTFDAGQIKVYGLK